MFLSCLLERLGTLDGSILQNARVAEELILCPSAAFSPPPPPPSSSLVLSAPSRDLRAKPLRQARLASSISSRRVTEP